MCRIFYCLILTTTFSATAFANCEQPFAPMSQLAMDMQTIRDIRNLPIDQRKQATHDYAAPRAKTWFERSLVIADWALATVLGAQVIQGFCQTPDKAYSIGMAAALLLPTLYFADLSSQIFHKWLDSYASEKNWLWGAAAREFRKHHEFPNNLNQTDYLSHVSAFGKLMAPFFVAANLVHWSPEWGTAVWIYLIAMLNTTEFHKQAHKKDPNAFFQVLQKARLALSHQEHLQHHQPPFDENYAVFNGWSNPLAARLKLWARLDFLMWKVFKKMPHNWIQDPRAIPKEVLEELKNDLQAIPPDLWEIVTTYPARENPEL